MKPLNCAIFVLSVATVGCESFLPCGPATSATTPLRVTVTDSTSGAAIPNYVLIGTRPNGAVDTLEARGDNTLYFGVGSAGGSYKVRIIAQGYVEWQRSEIKVSERCGNPTEEKIQVTLQKL